MCVMWLIVVVAGCDGETDCINVEHPLDRGDGYRTTGAERSTGNGCW